MREIADNLLAPGGLLEGAHPWVAYIGTMLVFCLIVFLFVAHAAGIYSWLERRIAGRIQNRVGPNRVGPQGFAQWAVDGLKTFQKEDLIPDGADSPLFRLAPYVAFVGMFGVFVALPFSSSLVIADINVAMVYILAVASIEAIGILLAGYASNSKWSFYGGMRSAAQIVSYEVPVALSIMSIIVVTGTLNLQDIIAGQGTVIWDWNFFYSPFTALAFFCYFIGAIAEINRAPFDLPEAESELVSGFATEYSGLRFLFFFFAEWANIYVISAIAVILFFGGWQVPGWETAELQAAGVPILYTLLGLTIVGAGYFGYKLGSSKDMPRRKMVTGDTIAATVVSVALGWGPAITCSVLLWAALSFGTPAWTGTVMANIMQVIALMVKTHILVFLVIQARWTLPRLRVDQMMLVCWKYLTPAAFLTIMGNAFWMVYVHPRSHLQVMTRYGLVAALGALVAIYFMKVFANIATTKDTVDMHMRV
ncbi:MAG: NADH-quinone oxidoreductase subunit H [Chrysiogenetes bacterium]|nr:NADH-quinone oxidoreductase subunit H [Chrysiogenetes bacterium]